MNLTITLNRAGNYEEGYHIFRQVVQQQPDQASAWLWLGYLSSMQEDWRAAERCFYRAKKLDHPKADQALNWLKEQTQSKDQ